MNTNRHKLDILQVFRGLAAIAVVFHHASISINAFSNEKIPHLIHDIFKNGYLGVDFFFVLSGFIILNSHYNDKQTLSNAKTYLVKRIVRIFPPYLPIVFLFMLIYLIFPKISLGDRHEISIISSIFLFPSNYPPVLSVAWTLIHEMVFYTIFLIFFINKRLFAKAIFIWVIFIFYLDSSTYSWGSYAYPKVLFSSINIEFVCGLLSAYIWRSVNTNSAMGLGLLFVGIIGTITMASQNIENYRYLYGIPFSLIVLGGAILEKDSNINFPKIFVLFGDASYSIYLIHNPLISVISRIMKIIDSHGYWENMLVSNICASIFCGILYHKLCEQWMLNKLKKTVFWREAKWSPRTLPN